MRAGRILTHRGFGHPLADILLLKYQPRYLEVTEGVSFYGRSGAAVLKSMERLGVNPLIVYGTNLVKCHDVDLDEGVGNCPSYWLEEFHITQPRLVVVMGRETLDGRQRRAHRRHEGARLGTGRAAGSHHLLQSDRHARHRRVARRRAGEEPSSGRRSATWANGSGTNRRTSAGVATIISQ